MILGIDFGASTTDAVLLQGKELVKKASSRPVLSARRLGIFLRKNGFGSFQIERVAVTGGKSLFCREPILGLKPFHVKEVDAIGLGASFLSNAKKCLAVSFGTGTCIVLSEGAVSKHVIGTGLGGGTITGLGRLLFGEQRPGKLAGLAANGDFRKVDLSVREVIGSGLGVLDGNATASNFAKGRGSRADIAAALQNMVAESVAVLAISASRQVACKKIVFVGKTPEFPLVKKRLKAAARAFKASFSFPKNGGFGTAIGAALAIQKRH